jgi:hypothetical protein
MVIKKSNQLIELLANFNRWEIILLDRAITGLNDDLTFRVDLPKIGSESNFHIKKYCETLSSKKINIYQKGNVLFVPLFEKLGIVRGQLTGIFNKNLSELLLDLTSDFTLISLDDTEKFKSKYTIRIFQILIKSKFRGSKIDFDIETFVNAIGYNKIDRVVYAKIITPSCKDISNKTNYDVDYKKIKNGKFTVGIEFYIKEKTAIEKPVQDVNKLVLTALTKKPANSPLGDNIYLKSIGFDVYFDDKSMQWKQEKIIQTKPMEKPITDKQKKVIRLLSPMPLDLRNLTSKQGSALIQKLNKDKQDKLDKLEQEKQETQGE